MLGDCWFLAALESSGQKDANMIKKLFINGNELNSSRIYGINFYDLGVPTTVVIDDYVPFVSSTGTKLAFTQATDNKGLWPVLLEKAFSKFHGNYDTLTGG
jgi:hypothetical protein